MKTLESRRKDTEYVKKIKVEKKGYIRHKRDIKKEYEKGTKVISRAKRNDAIK